MKKAIILAAGIGSRLRPLTDTKPKTLVSVRAKPILGHTLEALTTNGITDIVIIVGYFSDKVRRFCRNTYPNVNFTFIENKEYLNTNNLYSLCLAREHINEDVFILNGDLVFDHSIIKDMKDATTSVVAIEVGRYLEESMKVRVESDRIVGISKGISPADAYGTSIDVYKFVKSDIDSLVAGLEKTLKNGGERAWTEVAFDNLFASGALEARVCDIGKKQWMEIDTTDDLAEAELKFNPRALEIRDKKLFFVDNDGTLTLGAKVLPGAQDFLAALEKRGKPFYVLTNNSSLIPRDIVQKFAQRGMTLKEDQVLISTEAAMLFLKEQNVGRLFWVANEQASSWIKERGFVFDMEAPEALLLCYDTEITYEKITKLIELIRRGIPYYATHIDKVCPTEDGPIPDIGSFIEMVYASTGVQPLRVFGKPDKNFIEPILRARGVNAEDAVVIGDRTYTDMELASRAGAFSILVLSGETDIADYEASPGTAAIAAKNVGALVPHV